MGLFGSKKTYVSTTVYNLAGPIEDRPNYLKTIVLGNAISDKNFSLGSTLTQGYLHGPGMRLRSFFRWAQDNYTSAVGQMSSTLKPSINIDEAAIQASIPHGAGEEVVVKSSNLGGADIEIWAEQWILDNYPERIDEAWTASWDGTQGHITWPDTTVSDFMPWWYEPGGFYVFATYQLKYGYDEGPVVPGTVVTLGSSDSYPDNSGYTLDENTSTTHPVVLNTTTNTTVSYSDGRPNETSSDTVSNSTSYTDTHLRYVKTEYMGQSSSEDRLYSIKTYQSRDETGAVTVHTTTTTSSEVIAGGVTKTTTVEVVEDQIVYTRKYRIDTQDITEKEWSTDKVFIYKFGTGNASLDAMLGEAVEDEGYFPFIPVRANNDWVNENPLIPPNIFPLVKKAYRKSIGGRWSDLVEKLSDNEDLDDLDWIYVVFGVSLNTPEVAGRIYAYDLLKRCMESIGSGEDAMAIWNAQNAVAVVAEADWQAWKAAQADSGNPLYGTDEPPRYPLLYPPSQEIRIFQATQPQLLYDVRLSWNQISEDAGSGPAKPGAKKGDCWFEKGGTSPQEITYLWRQVEDNAWTRLTILGLTSKNYIWQDNHVTVTAHEALDDAEESGFLFPIHYPTYKLMGLIDGTQLSTSCVYLLINTFQVVKKKWYQTGIFKIFIVIVAIVISVYTGGLGGAGLLGGNAAVGASLGFTGLTASIVGGIANAFAAMLLIKMIGVFSNAVFGDQVGALITAIASFVAIGVGVGLANGQNLSLSMGQMMRAENIMKLANVVGRGYAGYVQASMEADYADFQQKMKEIEDQSKQISDLYAQNIGYGRGQFDPMSFLDVATVPVIETGDAFLTRTLMTGSDVVGLSLDLLSNFSDLTLSTDLAI